MYLIRLQNKKGVKLIAAKVDDVDMNGLPIWRSVERKTW